MRRSCLKGFKNPDVLTFYERGRELHSLPIHSLYMLKNEKEFFAVTASIFLNGTAEHPPYTRAKLKEAQPAYVDWLTDLFGFNPTDAVKPSAPLFPVPTSRARRAAGPPRSHAEREAGRISRSRLLAMGGSACPQRGLKKHSARPHVQLFPDPLSCPVWTGGS